MSDDQLEDDILFGGVVCFGADLPRDRTGDLVNSGEVTPGELVEYAAPITETFPEHGWSGEQIIALHRQHNAMRVAPPPRPGPFVRRSLRRFS
jgi:hypothetical protein